MSAICFNLDQSKILLSGNGLDQGADWTFSAFCPLSIMSVKGSQIYITCKHKHGLKGEEPRPIAQSVASQTGEQEVAGSIPGSANILSKD